MSLSIDQTVTLFEFLLMVLGIAIAWAIYYGSERAELPGDAKIPDPALPEDVHPTMEGRTL